MTSGTDEIAVILTRREWESLRAFLTDMADEYLNDPAQEEADRIFGDTLSGWADDIAYWLTLP